VELAAVVTDQLAIAIGQSQLYQQLHQVNQENDYLSKPFQNLKVIPFLKSYATVARASKI
jgi:hypothetical protein